MYKMYKPSDNMNITGTEMNKMLHEQQVAEYNKEQEKIKLRESTQNREARERDQYLADYQLRGYTEAANQREFLNNVKASLLSECIFKLYKDCSVTPLTESDKTIGKNLVNKFILENGAGNLIRKFSEENLLLSEMSRICNKYYNRIMNEACDKKEGCANNQSREFTIDDNTKEDFFSELQDLDTEDASKLIKERVSDAVSEFVDSNAEQKMEYEDIIKAAQDKMSATTNEAYIEQYSSQAKRQINEMKMGRKKNIFHYMVESLAKKSFKNNDLKAKYIHEATLNMDNIVNDSMLIYNFLEMVNTTNMVNVDDKFMNEYVKSLG